MERINLDGEWQLAYFPEGDYAVHHPDDLVNAGAAACHCAGSRQRRTGSHRAGVIPEPFYADNMRLLRPYEFHEWWYTRDFTVPTAAAEQRWAIVFAGLDTLATVWINGQEVGQSSDMLVEQRWDVSRLLRSRRNQPHRRAP